MKTRTKISVMRGFLGLCALIGLLPLSAPHAQQRDSTVTVRIINGHDAPQSGYPWMVALVTADQPDTTEAHFCGGTLIGPRHILTAAHCMMEFEDPSQIQVAIGGRELSYDQGVRSEIVGYKIHPRFNDVTLENDMAIIKLMKPVSNQPLALARKSDAALYFEGREATILGWGKIDPKLPILPTTLQEALVPIQTDRTCTEELGRFYKPQSMLCAGIKSSSPGAVDGVDSCHGDSGGPLIIFDDLGKPKQVGITSWGYGCASDKVRGVYSEIAANEDFALSFPDAPPMPKGTPTIPDPESANISEAGTTVICAPGEYFGDPVTSYSYKWYDKVAIGSAPIAGATSATYTLSATESNRQLLCSVIASNAGGDSREEFSQVIQVPLPNTSPEPELAPSASPNAEDTQAPRLSIQQVVCEQRLCSALIEAEDNESGISTLSAFVELKYQGRCSKGRSCSKVKNKPLQLKSLGRGFWSVSFRGYPRPKLRAKLTVVATDHAGNTERAELTKRVPLR